MSITIRQGAAALRDRLRHKGGFTLPEVLVSLCLLLLLLQGVWQWGVILQRGAERIQQNQQAVYLTQCCLADIDPELPDGWSLQVEREPYGETLQQTTVLVSYGAQQWPFYYIGRPEETDDAYA